MNRFLIFAGARTGSVTLAHCLRHTIANNYEVWKDPVIDEPFTQPLKLPPDLKRFMMDACFKLGIDFTLRGGRYKDTWETKPPDSGSKGKNTINKIPIPQLYRLLDIIYDEYIGIKHIYNQNLVWFNKALFDYAAYNDIKILYLHRRDVYDTALSKMATECEGVWSMIGDDNFTADQRRAAISKTVYEPINLDRFKGECRSIIKMTKSYEEYISHKEFNHKKIYYEDFLGETVTLDNRIFTFKSILDFLDYNYVENDIIKDALHSKTKQHSKEHYSKVPNIEEVYEWIAQETSQ